MSMQEENKTKETIVLSFRLFVLDLLLFVKPTNSLTAP
jgi:hypothetical protein